MRADRHLSFPETKGRTLEEIGALFGDEHIASQWYGLSEAEKMEIRNEAVKMSGGHGEGEVLRTEKMAV